MAPGRWIRAVVAALSGSAALLLLAGCEQLTPPDALAGIRAAAAPAEQEWRSYLGDAASRQYSPLEQLSAANVGHLTEVWRYDPGGAGAFDTQIPTNAIVVEGVLYGLSAAKNLFALNAATGEELWTYPFDEPHLGKGSGRGLVYWQGQSAAGDTLRWIVLGLGSKLYAVEASTGRLVRDFGEGGSVDLRVGLDRPVRGLDVSVTTPGTLYGDLLIQGFATSETIGAAPGYIRAYHLPSAELRWTFRTIPASGEAGSETWPAQGRERFGGANAWAGITVDTERGIAFVPTGSPAYDFYGADRVGDNLYANSLLALNASTGERLWHYQFVRHDLWDRDLPSPPNLITLTRNGETVPAVSQATKSGHLFIFHRETGEPLVPMTEVPVVGEGLPGEYLAATQSLPLIPPPFTRQQFEPSTRTADANSFVLRQLEGLQAHNTFVAPSTQGTVIYPGIDGGAQWGGQSYDPSSGYLYVNSSQVPYLLAMTGVATDSSELYTPFGVYQTMCSACHGVNRRGNNGAFPSLVEISERYSLWQTYRIIHRGRGRMPSFAEYPWYMSAVLAGYLHFTTAEADDDAGTEPAKQPGGYISNGFTQLVDHDGLPGSEPPWGMLTAIDTRAGDIAWQIPLGDYPRALELGLPGLGAENYGGPVATAGGLVFIAATPDRKIRAYDKYSGQLLWEDSLPFAGFATPTLYLADGRQFVVIAAGGGKLKLPSGSAYVAYALPSGP